LDIEMEKQADSLITGSIWFEGETTDNRRHIERQPANVGAKLKSPYSTGKTVRVDDISPEGCRITVAHLCAGDRVYIQIGGMEPWPAEVRWSDEDQAGLQFAHPLHPAVALHLSSSCTRRRQ
jgi:hypothetical protein